MPTALVCLGVSAALIVTGSATMEQARGWGMHGLVPLALVVLLEVVNVVGTWVWLTDSRTHIQWEAGAGVAVASIYSGVCAVLSYGLGGAIAPVGVLFTVHLAGRLLHRPGTQDRTQDARRDGDAGQATSVPAPVLTSADPTPNRVPAPELVEDGMSAEQDTQDASEDTEDGTAASGTQDTAPIPLSSVAIPEDEDVITVLVERPGKLPGIGTIAREHGIGKDKATRCKAEAERRRGQVAA